MSGHETLLIGQVWEGPLGGRIVRWSVTWVGTKKARLKAELEYGWANVTVDIARMLDSPDWQQATSPFSSFPVRRHTPRLRAVSARVGADPVAGAGESQANSDSPLKGSARNAHQGRRHR